MTEVKPSCFIKKNKACLCSPEEVLEFGAMLVRAVLTPWPWSVPRKFEEEKKICIF